MQELIMRLLETSRVQAGQLNLHYKHDLDLLALVERAIEHQKVTDITQHTFILEAQSSRAELVLSLDEARLEQVMDNLLNNAVKYSAKDTTITAGIKRQPGSVDEAEEQVLVWIRDQGYGISPQAQANIFDQFYRVQSEQTGQIKGFGLGLFISKEIVEQHKGQIWVESEEGVGSTFYFALPVVP